MKRLMLLIAAGSLWLFLAAVPVLADGGPHVAAINNGTSGINADSCAGCHRAHRAQGEFLLLADSGTALCLSCHGATGLGSKVDVESGMQYKLGTTDVRGDTVLGYLRGGGFVTARIGSGEAVRIGYTSTHGVGQLAKVPVRTAGSQPVTSAHLPNVGGVVGAADGVAWGNGPNSTHRIRRTRSRARVRNVPQPARQRPVSDPESDPGTCRNGHGRVRSGRDGRQRHRRGTAARRRHPQLHHHPDEWRYRHAPREPGCRPRSCRHTAGDYFRRKVPWNAPTGASNDAPNGQSATFTTQISTWCVTCHSRYLSQGWATKEDDAIFTYRHTATNTSRNCITCHVSHGSNAQMTGTYSANMEIPGRGNGVAPAGKSATAACSRRTTAGRASFVTIRRAPSWTDSRSARRRTRSFPSTSRARGGRRPRSRPPANPLRRPGSSRAGEPPMPRRSYTKMTTRVARERLASPRPAPASTGGRAAAAGLHG